MTEKPLIPAAQYLRMSTERQQYSLQNQMAAIERYGESHGFSVVLTYSDAAKSGVVLKRRAGLRQLLRDVVGGSAVYRVILVYDVSRWGRFQDSDEAAHYEFVCKSAGIPVHYCAETFSNDGTMPSLMMKALKRTMAGEYSRELSIKVFEGQKRLAGLGFKQGGVPGYGLRRMLVDCARTTGKQAGTELLLVCPIIRIQTRQPISNSAWLKGACQASPDTSKICRVRADTIEFCGYSAVVGSITDRIREIRLAGKPPCLACLRTAPSSGATYMQ